MIIPFNIKTFYQPIHFFCSGSKLAGVDWVTGELWISTNGGSSWTKTLSISPDTWNTVTMSSDGTRLAAIASTPGVYLSANSGTTWVKKS